MHKEKLLKLKASLITLSILATGSLTSCLEDYENISTDTTYTTVMDPVDKIEGNVTKDSVKIFEKGKHYISVRVTQKINNLDSVYAINDIPEGYDIFQITPIINTNEDNTILGYDIWFTNVEEVEVKATYSVEYHGYGYYTFGEVVEKEKTLTK